MPRSIACLALLFLTVVAGCRPTRATREEITPDENVRWKGLGEARELHRRASEEREAKRAAESDKLMAEFGSRMQEVAPHLPLVTVEETARPKEYQKITLNTGKVKFDAFRFRVPDEGGRWNMNWEFVTPGTDETCNMDSWYIVPREGTMQGFQNYLFEPNFSAKGVNLPKPNRRCSQQLPNGELKAGGEYVIWFSFTDENPLDAYVRIGVSQSGR